MSLEGLIEDVRHIIVDLIISDGSSASFAASCRAFCLIFDDEKWWKWKTQRRFCTLEMDLNIAAASAAESHLMWWQGRMKFVSLHLSFFNPTFLNSNALSSVQFTWNICRETFSLEIHSQNIRKIDDKQWKCLFGMHFPQNLSTSTSSSLCSSPS